MTTAELAKMGEAYTGQAALFPAIMDALAKGLAAVPGLDVGKTPLLDLEFKFAGVVHAITFTFQTPGGRYATLINIGPKEAVSDQTVCLKGCRWYDEKGVVYAQKSGADAGGGHAVGFPPTGHTLPQDAAAMFTEMVWR